jgi:hypothetical protein
MATQKNMMELYHRLFMFQTGRLYPYKVYEDKACCNLYSWSALKGFFTLPAIQILKPKDKVEGFPD